jgi:hypothetical protein
MDLNEVIAIAKTLRPGYRDAFKCLFDGSCCLRYDDKFFFADTPEEALRDAGWKG